MFCEEISKAYKESSTSYRKLFESKEFYNAIMNSPGNVIYRLMKNDETNLYSNQTKENNQRDLMVAEDDEEYIIEDKE